MDDAEAATADREVDEMVLTLLAPVAFLLMLLAMGWIEDRLCPAVSTSHGREVGPPVDRQPDDDLGARLAIPAQPVAGAVTVTVPATAQ